MVLVFVFVFVVGVMVIVTLLFIVFITADAIGGLGLDIYSLWSSGGVIVVLVLVQVVVAVFVGFLVDAETLWMIMAFWSG